MPPACTFQLFLKGLLVLALTYPWPFRPGRTFFGSMVFGWGVFNVVEGIIDHHILNLHHVVERELFGSGREFKFRSHFDQFRQRFCLHLPHHIPALDFDGDFAVSQSEGNLLIQHPQNYQSHDLALAGGEQLVAPSQFGNSCPVMKMIGIRTPASANSC